nr:hypothetical protein JVH1_7092 [Rhodococcus sp. JVH1]
MATTTAVTASEIHVMDRRPPSQRGGAPYSGTPASGISHRGSGPPR